MYQCKSIYNGETGKVEDCTCGRCEDALVNKQSKKLIVASLKEEIAEMKIEADPKHVGLNFEPKYYTYYNEGIQAVVDRLTEIEEDPFCACGNDKMKNSDFCNDCI